VFSKKLRLTPILVLLALLFAMSLNTMAQEPVEISIAGVGGAELQWLNEYVKPTFEALMAEAGTPVTVTTIEFTGSGYRQWGRPSPTICPRFGCGRWR
jgi:hypothetical protein